ncbi:mitochondrial amidoxime-reducing component 1 [Biomphalaria glabrata]|nr:mitochondrial amidoxime-reducing component 1-like [Biomphalaria glabrata]
MFLQQESAHLMATLAGAALFKVIALSYVEKNHRKRFQKIGTVANLFIYPVKSCGVTEVTEADCTSVGLQFEGLTDRHWMIIDENMQVLTMKEAPRLTLIKCISFGDSIRLTAPGMTPLELSKNPDIRSHDRQVKIMCQQAIPIVHCGSQAESWISTFLQRPARIVYSCSDLGVRDVFDRKRKWPNSARKGDSTIFSYLTSYLVCTSASLNLINGQLTSPVSMVNFRPSIVVENTEPFDEDMWTEVKIGEHVLFHSVEPCRRCTITTIDPVTAKSRDDRQPLELLKSFRCRQPYGTAPIFGLYLSLDIAGHIRVGDPVLVLKADDSKFTSQSSSYF